MDLFLKIVYSLIMNFVCFFAGYLACRQAEQSKQNEENQKMILQISEELKKLGKDKMDDESKEKSKKK